MVLQQAHSSFRSSKEKLDATRIGATCGAIALNIVVLMLLLVPAARLQLAPQAAAPTITWTWPEEKKPMPPPQPPPKDPVDVRKPSPVSHAKPAPVPVSQEAVIQPFPGDSETIVTLPDAPVLAAGGSDQPATVASAEPLAGVQLEYLQAPSPTYPRDALLARAEGQVLLRILVGIDGKPIAVTIQHSSGTRSLDEAARRYVLKHWVFRPATRDGSPVQAYGLVPIDFKLD